MTTVTQTRREVEVDTRLAELYELRGRLSHELSGHRDHLGYLLDVEREVRYGRRGRVERVLTQSLPELVDMANEALDNDTVVFHRVDNVRRTLDRVAEAQEKLRAALLEEGPLEDEFDQNQWSRFFLVNNTNGHIHSSMHCSTCYFDTRFSWLPTLSGLTEEDAVKEHGAVLCTVCFPSAPVEWTNKYELEEAAKKANSCPGSGTYDHNSSGVQYHYKRAECNHCGQTVNITPRGKLRKHKKEGS